MTHFSDPEPLSEADLIWLEELLLGRISDEENTEGKDEGILDLSELDGYLTAIVSAPQLIPPSEWFPAIWGDFQPQWKDRQQIEKVLSLIVTLMNETAFTLMENPQDFTPVFLFTDYNGSESMIVDDWCVGYLRGIGLCPETWDIETEPMMSLLMPIVILGSEAMFELRDSLKKKEIKALQEQIAGSAAKIHSYWLAQREDEVFGEFTEELPEYSNESLQRLSEPELIGLMMKDEDRVPRNVIDECAKRAEKMVDALAPMADANEGEEFETAGRWWMRLHAIMILGLIPGEKAGMMLLPFIDYLRFAEDGEFQDWFAGYWPCLTRNKPASVIQKLRELCEDADVDWYTRINLAESVIDDARKQGEQVLEADLDWLAAFVKDENEYWEFRFAAARCLLNFPRERYRELLGHIASLQSDFDRVFDQQDIDRVYGQSTDQPEWDNDREPWGFYNTEAIKARQQGWSNELDELQDWPFDDNELADGDFLLDDQHPFLHEPPMVGRDDPCPCGSGKKFGKCCLH
jgi:yecA family protein